MQQSCTSPFAAICSFSSSHYPLWIWQWRKKPTILNIIYKYFKKMGGNYVLNFNCPFPHSRAAIFINSGFGQSTGSSSSSVVVLSCWWERWSLTLCGRKAVSTLLSLSLGHTISLWMLSSVPGSGDAMGSVSHMLTALVLAAASLDTRGEKNNFLM